MNKRAYTPKYTLDEFARQYNGPSTCVKLLDDGAQCKHEAKFMPVIFFYPAVKYGDGYLPAGLLGFGLCEAHKALKLEDVDNGDPKGIVAIVKRTIKMMNGPPPDLDRTEIHWATLASRN